ncbi:serine hydrolase [Gracilibacillus massiliensis]|uniref:serine hydrolase n=1 Tax=Gracilibacillus massiliensis TaxID=1564956 RepID=UPI00071D2CD7|nr:serine hydrolase [Gracilibacillus massiliensis]
MYLFLWIVFAGFILLSTLPLLSSKNRTKWKITQAVVVTATVILVILAIELLQIPPLVPLILVVIVSFLTDKSTYTKAGLIITGVVLLLLAAGAYYLFHDDPDYVQKYIDNNPEQASIQINVNGETVVSQQANVKRPLASVVKTVIAIEYANQVTEGKIDPDQQIPLSELGKYYLENTDGGAHPAWLDDMKANEQIVNDEVPLHQVAKGMIHYSSNANTDFLIEKLGVESINRVIETLDLDNHDPVYPLVSALLTSVYLNHQHDENLSDQELEDMLQAMSLEEYRELVWQIHDELKQGEPDFFDETVSVPMDLQKVWSDRLPNATVDDYGKVMQAISNNTATVPEGEDILRDIMEWPMEMHQSNREKYAHFGAKGGSTAFIINQALYVEDNNGKKVELILFTEGFNFIERMKINQNINAYMKEILAEYMET